MSGMKRVILFLIIILLLSSSAFALSVEKIQLNSYVNDYTGTLTQAEIGQLNGIAKSLQESGKAELAIVIVDSLDGLTIEEYAITVAHGNLGNDQDNGLLILVALEERKYRAEVGYGLEGDFNDAKIGKLQRDYLVPAFQEGQYGTGLITLSAAIHKELMPEEAIPGGIILQQTNSGIARYFNFWTIFFIIMIVRGLAGAFNRDKTKKNRNLNDTFAAAFIASMFMRGGSGGMGGSGGFGGFGGGGFGGGGAGGSF